MMVIKDKVRKIMKNYLFLGLILGLAFTPIHLIAAGSKEVKFNSSTYAQNEEDNKDNFHQRENGTPITNKNAYFSGARAGEDSLDLARTCPGDSEGSVTEKVAAEIK
jgi:hypothetical protein